MTDSTSTSHPSSEAEDSDDSEMDDDDFDAGPERVPNLQDPLFPGGDCSKFECLLMILSFSLRHGLTQVATQDLCSLINRIVGGDYLPSSKHMLKKIFGRSKFHINFFCKRCESFVCARANGSKMEGVLPCEVCEQECTLSNMNDGHFFVTFSVKNQLRFLLENTENVMDLLSYRWTRDHNPDIISDIYDGEVYSELAKEGKFLSHHLNLSLSFNTDGAQVFDSSKNTLWPVFIRINEFPPLIRFNFTNCLLAGMWFSNAEPNMHLFLSDFVRECHSLYEYGFSWKTPTGARVKSKVILLNCIADSKAKPLVQNCKVHNGFWGCGYCTHPGKTFAKSSQAKYPMNDDMYILKDNSFTYTVDAPDPKSKEEKVFSVEDRENIQIRRDMELAEVNRNQVGEGDIQGVKGKSVLISLSSFDLVFGFTVEYMHAVLLGTTRQVTMLWFDSSSHTQLYYVGKRIDCVNKRLMNIKPPVTISRRPRKLCERKKWHANEWRSWLLYYSLPCLEDVLPTRYLKHHCLLVSAIFILLKDKISHDDLETATYYLGAYCREFSRLYSEELMYFNVHLLLHLGKSVTMWGPLFCYSAFASEGANGKLVNLVKGTRGVLNQIAEKYSKCKTLPKVVSMYRVDETVLNYCQDIMTYQPSQIAYKFDSVTVLGSLKLFPLVEEETRAFEASGMNITPLSYERMLIRNVMYHARCYMRKGEKSDSSVVQLFSGQFGVIKRIIDPSNVRNTNEPKVQVVLCEIHTRPREPITSHPCGASAEHIIMCAPIVFGSLRIISADAIKQLAILIDCVEKTFVTTFPNMVEKD